MRSSFAVTKNGIFIIDLFAKPVATISSYSFASRMAPSKIAVSPDEKWILCVQYDQWGSDIQMIEGSW